MNTDLPSITEIQAALSDLGGLTLARLSDLSGTPITTLQNIKRGESENPGIETVRKFWPFVQAARLGRDNEPARMTAKVAQ